MEQRGGELNQQPIDDRWILPQIQWQCESGPTDSCMGPHRVMNRLCCCKRATIVRNCAREPRTQCPHRNSWTVLPEHTDHHRPFQCESGRAKIDGYAQFNQQRSRYFVFFFGTIIVVGVGAVHWSVAQSNQPRPASSILGQVGLSQCLLEPLILVSQIGGFEVVVIEFSVDHDELSWTQVESVVMVVQLFTVHIEHCETVVVIGKIAAFQTEVLVFFMHEKQSFYSLCLLMISGTSLVRYFWSKWLNVIHESIAKQRVLLQGEHQASGFNKCITILPYANRRRNPLQP